MKKVLFTLLLAIVGIAAANAKDEVYLSQGSVASLKDGGFGYVILDTKDATYDNKKPLRKDERFMLIDDNMDDFTSEFIREFNDNSKKFKLTENKADAQYEFYVKITNVDSFVNVMSFKGGVGIKFWGSVTITDKNSGNVVAVFTIDEEDNSGYTYQLALEECFEGIAKNIAKKIKKGK